MGHKSGARPGMTHRSYRLGALRSIGVCHTNAGGGPRRHEISFLYLQFPTSRSGPASADIPLRLLRSSVLAPDRGVAPAPQGRSFGGQCPKLRRHWGLYASVAPQAI